MLLLTKKNYPHMLQHGNHLKPTEPPHGLKNDARVGQLHDDT